MNFTVKGYYDGDYTGLAESYDMDEPDDIEDFVWEMLNDGLYVEVKNVDTGDSKRFSSDDMSEDGVDLDFIYDDYEASTKKMKKFKMNKHIVYSCPECHNELNPSKDPSNRIVGYCSHCDQFIDEEDAEIDRYEYDQGEFIGRTFKEIYEEFYPFIFRIKMDGESYGEVGWKYGEIYDNELLNSEVVNYDIYNLEGYIMGDVEVRSNGGYMSSSKKMKKAVTRDDTKIAIKSRLRSKGLDVAEIQFVSGVGWEVTVVTDGKSDEEILSIMLTTFKYANVGRAISDRLKTFIGIDEIYGLIFKSKNIKKYDNGFTHSELQSLCPHATRIYDDMSIDVIWDLPSGNHPGIFISDHGPLDAPVYVCWMTANRHLDYPEPDTPDGNLPYQFEVLATKIHDRVKEGNSFDTKDKLPTKNEVCEWLREMDSLCAERMSKTAKSLRKGRTITITTHCDLCGKNHDVTVDYDQYRKWNGGMLIQNAMPDLSADDREMLQTGICPQCWEKFKKYEDMGDYEATTKKMRKSRVELRPYDDEPMQVHPYTKANEIWSVSAIKVSPTAERLSDEELQIYNPDGTISSKWNVYNLGTFDSYDEAVNYARQNDSSSVRIVGIDHEKKHEYASEGLDYNEFFLERTIPRKEFITESAKKSYVPDMPSFRDMTNKMRNTRNYRMGD